MVSDDCGAAGGEHKDIIVVAGLAAGRPGAIGAHASQEIINGSLAVPNTTRNHTRHWAITNTLHNGL